MSSVVGDIMTYLYYTCMQTWDVELLAAAMFAHLEAGRQCFL